MIPQFIVQALSNTGDPNKVSEQIVRVVNNVQTQLDTILKYLTNKVQADSVLLQNISLQTGSNTITHTLGRTLTGWEIVDIQSASVIYRTKSTDPNTYLVLNASAPAVVSLLVF